MLIFKICRNVECEEYARFTVASPATKGDHHFNGIHEAGLTQLISYTMYNGSYTVATKARQPATENFCVECTTDSALWKSSKSPIFSRCQNVSGPTDGRLNGTLTDFTFRQAFFTLHWATNISRTLHWPGLNLRIGKNPGKLLGRTHGSTTA